MPAWAHEIQYTFKLKWAIKDGVKESISVVKYNQILFYTKNMDNKG